MFAPPPIPVPNLLMLASEEEGLKIAKNPKSATVLGNENDFDNLCLEEDSDFNAIPITSRKEYGGGLNPWDHFLFSPFIVSTNS